MKKFLIIQTAFIGDVILATCVVEKLRMEYPIAQIDFLLRKGNESLLKDHPKIDKLWIWNKKKNKYKNLYLILKQVQSEKYDYVINLQRFLSSGIFTIFSGARIKIGFDKNPLSRFFTLSLSHEIGTGKHETERNLSLISTLVGPGYSMPALYPSADDRQLIKQYQTANYVCLAPASVWYTKQLPIEKWVELACELKTKYTLIFIGAPADKGLCNEIVQKAEIAHAYNLCGEISLLQSAELMRSAKMNYVNDSAPMHLASALNAPTTAFFCSTLPQFGFGPLSKISFVAQIDNDLECRPCGLHGKKNCPKGHFACAYQINIKNHLV